MRSQWALDPDVLHLNHGSFGATPQAVLAAQLEVRARFEANPTGFIEDHYLPELDAVRARLSDFLGADPAGVAFVPNATTGVASVVTSLALSHGDEVVITDHAYNACRNIVDVVTARAGAATVVAPLAFPGAATDQVIESVLSRVTDRTRLVLIDHITSPTALVLPVEEIVSQLEPDTPVLVDGAHAPGMIPLELDRLGASYYAGNLHKWVCAPKGTGCLVVAERHRDQVRPTVISHGWNTPRTSRSLFHRLFDWTGTFDPSAWLAVPSALDTMAGLRPGGWPDVMAANRDLAAEARQLIAEQLGVEIPTPASMLGAMAALPLRQSGVGLAERLRRRDIVVAVPPWPTPDHHLLRISAQLYNTIDEYAQLVDAIAAD